MDYVIQTPLQLASHLRALRKIRGLSQAALGSMLGVGQTRVARIEGEPTAISVEQLIAVLAALDVRLVLRDNVAAQARDAAPTMAPAKKAPAKNAPAKKAPAKKALKRRPVDGDW